MSAPSAVRSGATIALVVILSSGCANRAAQLSVNSAPITPSMTGTSTDSTASVDSSTSTDSTTPTDSAESNLSRESAAETPSQSPESEGGDGGNASLQEKDGDDIDPVVAGLAGASPEIDALWEQEGATLRELVTASVGEERAEALLRIGEWERDSVERLVRGAEAGHIDETGLQSELERRWDAADKAYSEALELASQDRLPIALFALGDLRRGRGDFEQAREPLSRVVDEHSDHPLALDAAIALGDDAFDAGALADAMRRYEFAAAGEGRGAAYARYKLGWCFLNLEEYDKAREAFIDVSDSSKRGEAELSLGHEALRDLVLALARDHSVGAAEARALLLKHASEERAPRLIEGYARIISESGRDEEALALLRDLWPDAEPKDALRMLAADLEIAIRRRDLQGATAAATHLAFLVEEHGPPPAESAEPAERALRVAAVTIHGEGRASGDAKRNEAAVTLYESYFRAFPDWDAAYELHHHAGELLHKLGRHDLAERHYTASVLIDLERVNDGQEPGKWLARSAHGAVVSAFEALPEMDDEIPDASSVRTAAVAEEDEGSESESPAPPARALGEPQQRLVEACDRYLHLLPQGEHVAEVAYRRAMVLFGHNRFGAAASAFREVALAHAEHEVGAYSARLSLEALRVLHRYDELASLAGDYLETPAFSSSLGEELERLREQALLAAAARASRLGRPDEAARRYLEFANQFPQSEAVDRALYNGASSLTLLDRHLEAVEIRERLLRTLPKSSLADRARERQLADLLSLGRFEDAAKLAEAAANEARGAKRAQQLHDAIVLFEAAGQRSRADELREVYLSRHRWGEEAPEHALALAAHSSGCTTKRRRLERALSLAPDSSYRAVFLGKLARHELACGRIPQALHHARAVVRLESRVEKDRADALDAVADSALLMAEQEVKTFRALPLRAPWERTLPKKLSALERAETALSEVVTRGRAQAAVCALVESASALGGLSVALLGAEPPPEFNEEQQLLFAEQLAERAQPLLDRARQTVAIAVSRAGEAGVMPPCFEANAEALAKLWPERFGPIREALLPIVSTPDIPDLSAQDILARAPDAPAAWLLAARAELAADRPQSALLLLERITEDDPLRSEAEEWKARALLAAGQDAASLAMWTRIARDHADRSAARRVLAQAALDRRDLDGALTHLNALLVVEPEDVSLKLARAAALRMSGDFEGAEEELTQALTAAVDLPEPRLNLGLLFCEDLGRPREGLALLDSFEEKGGEPPDRAVYAQSRETCAALAKVHRGQ